MHLAQQLPCPQLLYQPAHPVVRGQSPDGRLTQPSAHDPHPPAAPDVHPFRAAEPGPLPDGLGPPRDGLGPRAACPDQSPSAHQ